MRGVYQIFHRKGSIAVIGFILATALIAGLMISCKEESSKPTAPSIPVGPDWQTSENSNEMGFYSGKGDGQFGAFVNDSSEFQISVPAGDFLLTYVVNGATYYVAFRATEAAILHIGLHQGARVSKASIKKGRITSESQKKWQSNDVTLFAWPDGPAWNSVFESDGSAAITLIDNQQVAPDVVILPEPQPGQNPQPAANPQPQTPTVTVTPAGTPTVVPTKPPVTPESELMIAEITDPNTNKGVVVTGASQNETLIVSGAKDSSGYLTSITGATLVSTKNNAYAHINFGSDALPTSIEYSDGMTAEFSNYTDKSVGVTIYDRGVKKGGPYTVPADMNAIRGWQADIKQVGRIADPTNTCNTDAPHHIQYLPIYLKGISLMLSEFGCFVAVDAAVLSGGLAIPLAMITCGSALLDAMDYVGMPIPPTLQRLNDLYSKGSLVQTCLTPSLGNVLQCGFGVGKLVYDETHKAEAAGTLDTPCKQEDACPGVETVCKKWSGMYYYYGVNDCWCNYDSGAFCTGNHPKFLSECRGISGTVSGCVVGVSYCKTK